MEDSDEKSHKQRVILTRSRCDKAKCPSQKRPRHTRHKRSTNDARPSRRANNNVVVVGGYETRLAKLQQRPNLLSLPREIHLVVLSYLGSRDLHTMRQVSVYFEEIARDPMLWKDYEVQGNKIDARSVINDLKRMPFLKKIAINNRVDCDEILRQISLSNKNLEQLAIVNSTGSTSNLHLRAGNLTRIAKRCRRLHTFQILGSRFRGLKLFRMLAETGPRLRNLLATTTRAQFQEFARNARHVAEKDRKLLVSLPRNRLATMHYRIVTVPAAAEASGQQQQQQPVERIVVTYQDNPLGLIDIELRPADETEATGTDASTTK